MNALANDLNVKPDRFALARLTQRQADSGLGNTCAYNCLSAMYFLAFYSYYAFSYRYFSYKRNFYGDISPGSIFCTRCSSYERIFLQLSVYVSDCLRYGTIFLLY